MHLVQVSERTVYLYSCFREELFFFIISISTVYLKLLYWLVFVDRRRCGATLQLLVGQPESRGLLVTSSQGQALFGTITWLYTSSAIVRCDFTPFF